MAIPLVVASLLVGIGKLGDIGKLSRIGGKTLGIFIITTTLAISMGLISVNLINPGNALSETTRSRLMASYSQNAETREQAAGQVLEEGPLAPVVNLVPANMVDAASSNTNMLQVLVVKVLFGVAMLQIPFQKTRHLFDFFDSLNDVIMKLIDYIMLMAPYGAFALIAAIMVELAGEDPMETLRILNALGLYSLAVVAGLIFGIGLQLHREIYGKNQFPLFSEADAPGIPGCV